jgi:hypothetical protein
MGHNISAIIGKKPINEQKLKSYQLALAYESDFAIVILDQDSMWYWADELNLSVDSESERIRWACELSFFFAREIGMTKYAIINTDYFAGMGGQAASLYENGIAILPEKSINEVLNALGVIQEAGKDEFDTLNLGEYRESEYYYWNSGNWADDKPNMIAGRIPDRN